jgi:DNA replication and repair protein RecF
MVQSHPVHLTQLRLRDFRNYRRADLALVPGFHLFLGSNAQGKTNLLEAIYLLATLRSFRGVGGAQLVRHDAKGYFLGATVVGPATCEIKAYWSARERKLQLNGRPIRRWSEYLGTVRAVVFCTEDLLLVKGVARGRRRFVDLLLTQTRPGYLGTLLRYTQALKSRNALLKQSRLDETLLEGFTQEMVEAGEQLVTARRELVPRLAELAGNTFQRIAHASDTLTLEYQPNLKNDFAIALANSRSRERVLRSTLVGPHRDDLTLLINGQTASQYASEGQKRTLALALKMAQVEYLAAIHGTPPIVLIDDVMGELDVRRRSGFLPLLQQANRVGGQVFMTCTEENWPQDLGVDLHRWEVSDGVVTPA